MKDQKTMIELVRRYEDYPFSPFERFSFGLMFIFFFSMMILFFIIPNIKAVF